MGAQALACHAASRVGVAEQERGRIRDGRRTEIQRGRQPMKGVARIARCSPRFFLLTAAATARADSAYVLWAHVWGVVDGRIQNFWLRRAYGG
jgi:hypothetical protein